MYLVYLAAIGTECIALGTYASKLESGARARYLYKIQNIKEDPYIVKNFTTTPENLPPVDYGDIAHYLIYSTSYLTAAEMKARKSLDCYINFLSGWVLSVEYKEYPERFLIRSRVSIEP